MSVEYRPGKALPAGWLAAEIADTGASHGWDAAASVWGGYWDRLAVEDPAELLNGLKALPGEAFLHNPGLVVAGNYLQRLVIDGDPARFGADPRVGTLMDSGNDHGTEARLTLLTGEIAGARSAGEPESALESIAAAHTVLQAAGPEELAQMTGPLASFRFQWGRTLDAADNAEAVSEYEEAYELAQLSNQRFLARRAASQLAWYYADRGHLRLTDSWLARALSFPETNPRYDAVLYLAAAVAKLDRRDIAGADVELARFSAVPAGESWAAALWVRSLRVGTTSDATELAAQMTEEFSRHTPTQQRSRANSRYIRAAQMRLASFGTRTPQQSTVRVPAHLEQFAAALEALRRKRYAQALEHSERARRLGPSVRVSAGALLVQAVAQRAVGQDGHAIEAFRRAKRIIDSEGLHTTYNLIPAAEAHKLSQWTDGHPLRGPQAVISNDGLQSGLARLTDRQREILFLLASDRTLNEIAGELFISPNTLKSSLRSIYASLGVNSRRAAADIIRRHSPR